MRHTAYRAPQRGDGRHAVGYDLVNDSLARAPHVFSGWGNSGIESTASDMARWVAALARGEILKPASYRAMWTPGRLIGDTVLNFPFRGSPSAYGFGWFLTSYRGAPLNTHGGAIAGFSSVVHRFTANGWSVIVLSNGKQGADRQNQADVVAQAVVDVAAIAGR
jgi:CubicO group peptidase (beta-lactamase class C family)